MNPFERIKEMKQTLMNEIKDNDIKSDDTITYKEHYKRLVGLLNILEKDLENAEYNYQAESINGSIHTFDEFVVLQRDLNDNIIIFQPIADSESFSMTDMSSLAEILTKLHESGQIEKNIILLPPNVNVLNAKLVKSSTEDV